jgi:hypothetical protein
MGFTYPLDEVIELLLRQLGPANRSQEHRQLL